MRKLLASILLVLLCISALAQDQSRLSYLITNYKYREALAHIDSLPPSRELSLKKAACHKALQEYKVAATVLERLDQEYPEDALIKSELALCYEALDKPTVSLEYYNQVVAIDSTNLFFRLKKADLLYKMEQYSPALEMYQTMLEKDSAEIAVKRIAQSFDKLNQLDSAAYYYNIAMTKDSADLHAAANLINLQIRMKKFEDAIQLSDLYVQKDSTNKTLNVLNALSYYGMEDYSGSAKRFQRCYDNHDSSLVVNRSLGFSYFSLDRSRDAVKYLEKAYQQDTTSVFVLYHLASSYSNALKTEEAIEAFNKLIERTLPKKFELYLYYLSAARDYKSDSQYLTAAQYYQSALEYAKEADKRNLYYEVAQLYQNLINDKNQALKFYGLYRKEIEKELTMYKNKTEKTEEDEDAILQIERSLDRLDLQLAKMQ